MHQYVVGLKRMELQNGLENRCVMLLLVSTQWSNPKPLNFTSSLSWGSRKLVYNITNLFDVIVNDYDKQYLCNKEKLQYLFNFLDWCNHN